MDELNRVDIQTYKSLPKMPVVVVLENIRSMHNIGSVFRTSDAFRVEKIHLCGITALPPNNEIHKAALGATDSVDWKHFQSTEMSIRELKQDGYLIIAIEQTTESLSLEKFNPGNEMRKTAIVLGNEVNGISENTLSLCDRSIEIPQLGTKHSLNVSVAAGILLWHYYFCWKAYLNK